tara:strand:- start:155 stop:484 length:330 start_codon:yes stop_codon:yes gene_type:complete
MEKLNLFHTPKSWDELMDWIDRHHFSKRKKLIEIAGMGYNLAVYQGNKGKIMGLIPKEQLFTTPKSWDELMDKIDESLRDERPHLITASAMGFNLASSHYSQKNWNRPD